MMHESWDSYDRRRQTSGVWPATIRQTSANHPADTRRDCQAPHGGNGGQVVDVGGS